MCRLYGVTRGGYYAWRSRGLSDRRKEDLGLKEWVKVLYERSHGIYGAPRIQADLVSIDKHHSKKRIARLMVEGGLEGRCMRIYRSNRGHAAPCRNIDHASLDGVDGPNQAWVGDVTYIKVCGQWHYLAVVMDWFTRRIVGWSLGDRRTVALTLRALNQAVRNRCPDQSIIFHSDRGVEYIGNAFRNRLKRLGFIQSVNRLNRMNDNARMESFFGSLKSEWLYGLRFDTVGALRGRIESYMPFYNQQRMHSSLEYMAPATYEESFNN